MAKTKKVYLLLEIEAPDKMDADEVAALVNKMIDVGAADAADTVADRELSRECRDEARDACSLDIKAPTIVDSDHNVVRELYG